MANAPTLTGITAQQPTTHRAKPAQPTPRLPKRTSVSSDPSFLYTPYPPTATEFDWSAVSTVPSAPNSLGYDATGTRLSDRRRSVALNAANAVLSDGVGPGSYQMRVFVTDVSIDTALAGSTAQSMMTRDFYAHNFVQPSFTVSGVSLDQNDYALLCEFVHSAQQKSVANGYVNLTQLRVLGRNPNNASQSRGVDGTRTSGTRVTLSQAATLMGARRRDPDLHGVPDGHFINQLIRGSHLPILAKGYIATMPRIHQKFQYAVAWQFDFVVAAMLDGIYTDSIVKPNVQKTWVDMLNDAKAQGVITASKRLEAENKAALAYAKANAATMFPNANSGGNTSNNSGTGGSSAPGTGNGAWIDVTATYFTDVTFACPSTTTATNGGFLFAELNHGINATGGLTNPTLGPLFGMSGPLPCGFKLEVLNPATGKAGVFIKGDIGTGAPGASIDLWQNGSDGIGFTSIGKGPVKIRAA